MIEAKTVADVEKIVDTALLTGLRKQGLVSNIKFIGDPKAAGYFSNGNYINISRGLLLTTGLATNAKGPNKMSSATGTTSAKGDPDLEKLGGDKSFDACVIEFDFIPMTDKVKFKYVFGSEEYNRFVGSKFNDVFGFFISGPGITGPFSGNSKNIALIPGTTDPVSINNINNGQEDDYRKPPPGPGVNAKYFRYNDQFPEVPGSEKAIEYNGFTTVFTAEETVVPCKTYHMKLAISDISDAALDSGVFLEAQSFDIGDGGYEIEFSHESMGKEILDGCNEAIIKIKQADLTEEKTVAINYSGTAVLGTDIENLPDHVILTPSQPEQTITVKAKIGMPKEKKTLNVSIENLICGEGSSIEYDFDVIPYSPIKITNETEMEVVCKDKVDLSATYDGGYAPFEYKWSSGSTKQNASIPIKNNPVHLKVSDRCTSDEVDIKFNVKDVTADFGMDKDKLCGNESVGVNFDVDIPDAAASLKWSFDGGNAQDQGGNKYIVNWETSGEKKVRLEVKSALCGDAEMEKKVMVYVQPKAVFADDALEGCSPVDVKLEAEGDYESSVTYKWDLPSYGSFNGKQVDEKIDKPGTYDVHLTVSNAGVCNDEITKEKLIKVFPNPNPDIIPHNEWLMGDVLDHHVSSANNDDDWTYKWTVNQEAYGNSPSIVIHPNEEKTATVGLEVENRFGCVAKDERKFMFVLDKMLVPNALSPEGINKFFKTMSQDVRSGEVYIFNKWGEKIFYSSDLSNPWDGRVNGKMAPHDAYVVKIFYTTVDGRKKTYSGMLYLIR